VGTLAEKSRTLRDFEALAPETRAQLIDGEIIMSPAPTPGHQICSGRIHFALYTHLRNTNSGIVLYAPVDVILGEGNAYQPDIIVVSNERRQIITEKRVEGAPDLVFEILSPATAYYDLRRKKDTYGASGVREYWVVDPLESSIEIFAPAQGEFRLRERVTGSGKIASQVLTGFEIDLAPLFA